MPTMLGDQGASSSMILSVERIGEHTGIRYGASYRVLPTSILRTPRGVHVIAELLWDSEHAKPNGGQPAKDWNGARRRAIDGLAERIAGLSTMLYEDGAPV